MRQARTGRCRRRSKGRSRRRGCRAQLSEDSNHKPAAHQRLAGQDAGYGGSLATKPVALRTHRQARALARPAGRTASTARPKASLGFVGVCSNHSTTGHASNAAWTSCRADDAPQAMLGGEPAIRLRSNTTSSRRAALVSLAGNRFQPLGQD